MIKERDTLNDGKKVSKNGNTTIPIVEGPKNNSKKPEILKFQQLTSATNNDFCKKEM